VVHAIGLSFCIHGFIKHSPELQEGMHLSTPDADLLNLFRLIIAIFVNHLLYDRDYLPDVGNQLGFRRPKGSDKRNTDNNDEDDEDDNDQPGDEENRKAKSKERIVN
jgi:hypothetical protein